MRKLLIGVAAAALVSSAANAADLSIAEPAPVVSVPSFSWTGFYLGAQVGYGWQD